MYVSSLPDINGIIMVVVQQHTFSLSVTEHKDRGIHKTRAHKNGQVEYSSRLFLCALDKTEHKDRGIHKTYRVRLYIEV